MVTGDQHAIAVETCNRLGLGTDIMHGEDLLKFKTSDHDFAELIDHKDGFAGVYPEHKHRIVEALQCKGRLVGMTGDALHISHDQHSTGFSVCKSSFALRISHGQHSTGFSVFKSKSAIVFAPVIVSQTCVKSHIWLPTWDSKLCA